MSRFTINFIFAVKNSANFRTQLIDWRFQALRTILYRPEEILDHPLTYFMNLFWVGVSRLCKWNLNIPTFIKLEVILDLHITKSRDLIKWEALKKVILDN